jgi:hypothetical protein
MSYFVFSPTSLVILTVAKYLVQAYWKDPPMAIKDPKDIFVRLLSDIRQGTERTSKVFQEISQAAQNPEIKQALEARVFISGQLLAQARSVLHAYRRAASEAQWTPSRSFS